MIYNPTCEMAVQNNTVSYQPPVRLREFEEAMSSLMMFLAHDDDAIVGSKPDAELLSFWRKLGVAESKFVTREESNIMVREGATIYPWGGSKQLYHSYGMREVSSEYDEAKRVLLSRVSSVALEREVNEVCREESEKNRKYKTEEPAQVVANVEEMEQRVRRGMCAVKSLWSSSGRGVQLVRESQHIEPAITWARGKIRHDGGVVCEPFYRREREFTTLFYMSENGEVRYLGVNYFEADEAGRFGKEIIGKEYLTKREEIDIANILTESIERVGWGKRYIGHIGIDGMIYVGKEGERRVRVCTEVNLRHTMGNVNLAVGRFFARNTTAEWQIEQFADASAWEAHCQQMAQRYPTVIDAEGKIESGFFRLTSLGYNYGAWGIAQVKKEEYD